MSTPPNRFTAASTILSQFAAEFGRTFTASVLAPSAFAFGGDRLERIGAAGGKHQVAAGAGEHLGGERTERAGGAGHDRGLAAHVEQGERIFQEIFGHDRLTKQV